MYLIDRIDAFLDSEKAQVKTLNLYRVKSFILIDDFTSFSGFNKKKLQLCLNKMTNKYVFLADMCLTKMKFWGVFCFL